MAAEGCQSEAVVAMPGCCVGDAWDKRAVGPTKRYTHCKAKANPTSRPVNSSSLSAIMRFLLSTLFACEDFDGEEIMDGSEEFLS